MRDGVPYILKEASVVLFQFFPAGQETLFAISLFVLALSLPMTFTRICEFGYLRNICDFISFCPLRPEQTIFFHFVLVLLLLMTFVRICEFTYELPNSKTENCDGRVQEANSRGIDEKR